MIDDPTTTETRSPGVRPSDHLERRDGATRDSEDLWALVASQAGHREAQAQTALRVGRCRRGYTYAQHERSEALRRRAPPIHDRADEINRLSDASWRAGNKEKAKWLRTQSAALRVEAVGLEVEADRLVPAEYQRDLQKAGQP